MNSPDGRVMTIYDCICPESPTTSRIFISLARNYDRDTPEKEIQKWQAAVNDEDRWVVESQLPKLLPLSPKTEKHIAADAWSLSPLQSNDTKLIDSNWMGSSPGRPRS